MSKRGKTKEEYNAYFREYRAKNREKLRKYNREYNRLWRQKNTDKKYLKLKGIKMEKMNKERRKAYDLLNYAIRSGMIDRKPCEVCGVKKAEGHHKDYSKPLEVIWLCKKHHAKKHKKLRI